MAFLEMERLRPSGEVFDYTSVNTELLTWLVETVAGERFVDFIEREIWQKTGSEGDALIATTPNGGAFSAGGVSTTLRDLARYGILFTAWGRSDGTPTISNSYLRSIQESGRAELTSAAAPIRALLGGDFRHNSYQWDVVTVDGDFFKGGLGGQGLYVSLQETWLLHGSERSPRKESRAGCFRSRGSSQSPVFAAIRMCPGASPLSISVTDRSDHRWRIVPVSTNAASTAKVRG